MVLFTLIMAMDLKSEQKLGGVDYKAGYFAILVPRFIIR